MAVQAGQLLVVRRHLTLQEGITTVDTGITQASLGVDPPVGGTNATADAAGVASRVEVKMLAPIAPWVTGNIRHGEPRLNDAGTIEVDFWVEAGTGEQEINVLFWDPHTAVTPMDADAYTESVCAQPELRPAGGVSPTQGGSNNTPNAAGSAFTVTDPANADGQFVLAIFALRAFGDFANPISDPILVDAGWTTILTGGFAITGGADGMKFVVAYRISSAADPAVYTFDSDGAGWRGGANLYAMVQYDASDPIQSSDVGAAVAVAADPLVLQAPSLTVPAGALPTLICGYICSTTSVFFTSQSGMTSLGSQTSGSGARTAGMVMTIFRQSIAAAGPTGTKQATRDDALNLSTAAGIAFSVALTPACGIFPDGSSPEA